MKIHSYLVISTFALAGFSQADYDFNNYGDEPFVFFFNYSVSPDNGTMQDILWAGGGNPGGFYEFRGTWSTGKYEIIGGMAADLWYADQTATDYISSIDVTTDYRKNAGGANLAPQILITQGNHIYAADLATNSGATNTWLTVSKHLTASDFYEIPGGNGWGIGQHDFNSHPNFGASGPGISPYMGSDMFSATSSAPGSAKMQYDNYLIHVNTVPEPVSSLAILSGIAGLAVRRRRSARG